MNHLHKSCHRFPLFISLATTTTTTTPCPLFLNRNSVFASIEYSAMFTSNGNGVAKKNSGKRKMTEVSTADAAADAAYHHQINLFNLQGHQFASPSVPGGHHSQVQRILNTAAPIKPFSFMSLLTANEEEDDSSNPLSNDINNKSQQIDEIISFHTENLRQELWENMAEEEERAAKKLKKRELELQRKLAAQNAELERMVELYKGETERLLIRVRYLERSTMSLKERLQEANAARRYAETAQEEAESSFEDPDRVEPVCLSCKVCERKLATVMIWPCRHVCVCKCCEAAAKFCPVCHSIKTTSIEVFFPLNEEEGSSWEA